MVAGLAVRRRHAEPSRQLGENGVVDGAAALGHEGKLDEPARRLDRWMRASVNLAEGAGPALVGRQAHHIAGKHGLGSVCGVFVVHLRSRLPDGTATLV
jgi:hypothetical protein